MGFGGKWASAGVRVPLRVSPAAWPGVIISSQTERFRCKRTDTCTGRRFLWIADLGRPDGWIALAAAALVGASVLLAPAGSAPNAATNAATMIRVSAMLAVVSTLMFVVSAPAATVVSVAAGAVSGVVQGWVGRRQRRSGRA